MTIMRLTYKYKHDIKMRNIYTQLYNGLSNYIISQIEIICNIVENAVN